MVNLVEVKKNTRGANTREIKYMAIGKYVPRIVEKESKPAFNDDGTPKLDEDGNQVRIPLGKDANGKLITIKEEVLDFVSDGVLTDISDALSLVDSNEQLLLDCFAEGWNERQYSIAANKDELDEFIRSMDLDDDEKATFKRTARQLNRNYDMDLLEAAEFVKTQFIRAKAKAKAKEVAA